MKKPSLEGEGLRINEITWFPYFSLLGPRRLLLELLFSRHRLPLPVSIRRVIVTEATGIRESSISPCFRQPISSTRVIIQFSLSIFTSFPVPGISECVALRVFIFVTSLPPAFYARWSTHGVDRQSRRCFFVHLPSSRNLHAGGSMSVCSDETV